jgi:arginine deiminase
VSAAATTPDALLTGTLRVESEVGYLRRVLVCSPGEELRRVPPDQRERYLVEDVLWLDRAREQHAAFTAALELLMRAAPGASAAVAPVVDLRDELRRALTAQGDSAAASALLDEIAAVEPDLRPAEAEDLAASLREDLRAGKSSLADDLIAGVLAPRPRPGGSLFRVAPSPNVVFARDYPIVLGGAAFLSSMAKQVRWKEPALARFLFHDALGLGAACFDLKRPTLGPRAQRLLDAIPGRLAIEGGDVMALSRDTIIVGISERTTWKGATALALALRRLKAERPEAFPFRELCAATLPARRAMMHLDTVFTLVDHGLALAFPPLTFPNAREEMAVYACDLEGDPEAPIEMRWAGPFSRAMGARLGSPGRPLTLIAGGGDVRTAQHREQWCDACNAVAVGPGVALSYARNDRTLAALAALSGKALTVTPGVTAPPREHLRPFHVVPAAELDASRVQEWMRSGERVMVAVDGSELGRARGGPHCMTMALHREELR